MMRRVPVTEWLDHDRGTPAEIQASLGDLWRINRRLGGISTNLRLFEHFFSRTGPHAVRVLDVGTGDARLASRLRSELQSHGRAAEFFVLDRHWTHLASGNPAAAGLTPVVGNALDLPFGAGTFDVVMCNLFLHHFSAERAEGLLRSLGAAAREAVLVNDLERHWIPYVFIRCAYPFARSRITRHDGPASVRQAYTRQELAALARAVGFEDFEVLRLPAFRLGLLLWKTTKNNPI
jgi:2-polyprenyl-3-methyl-5-hydroxy-6-metoxy-1,4-benzoquinol methylase